MKKIISLSSVILLAIITSSTNAALYTIGGSSQTSDWHTTAPSGSNFTMLDPTGSPVDPGGLTWAIDDIVGTFDDSKICFSEACTDVAMTLSTVTPFQSFLWTVHDIRVFGPGTYNFDTVQAGNLSLSVGAGQLGAHMLLDWSINTDIDIAVLWDLNATFTRPATLGPFASNADTRTYDLASVDGNGNGIAGIPMVEGPYSGFSANFSLFTHPVPIPGAVWLFGSGLIGLVSFARRKKRA